MDLFGSLAVCGGRFDRAVRFLSAQSSQACQTVDCSSVFFVPFMRRPVGE
jgi:hypothetical protein